MITASIVIQRGATSAPILRLSAVNMDYAVPASTWAPVHPETLEVVAPAGDIDVGPAATGADVGVP